MCSIFDEDLFFFLVFTWIRGKKVFHLHFIFGLHYISTPEQNRGRGSSLPMLKIGQNWGKIANYPPQCSTKIGTTALKYLSWMALIDLSWIAEFFYQTVTCEVMKTFYLIFKVFKQFYLESFRAE